MFQKNIKPYSEKKHSKYDLWLDKYFNDYITIESPAITQAHAKYYKITQDKKGEKHYKKLYTELVKQKDNSKNDIKFELKEKFDKFELELRNYLMKTNQLLAKICQLYSSKGLEFSNNRFYIKNNLPPNPVNFDHNNAFQVAKLCIDTVNNCIKAALSRELTVDEIKKIWICHHSLNCIMISKKSLFEAASRPVQEEESQDHDLQLLLPGSGDRRPQDGLADDRRAVLLLQFQRRRPEEHRLAEAQQDLVLLREGRKQPRLRGTGLEEGQQQVVLPAA
jgi:hypothetical protein